jgi:hypothetical protein
MVVNHMAANGAAQATRFQKAPLSTSPAGLFILGFTPVISPVNFC